MVIRLLTTLQQSYNNHAAVRDQSEIEPWKLNEREQFLIRIRQAGFRTLLEIGAGTGRDSLYFQKNGLKVTAVDFAEEMVRLCKAKGLADVRLMDFTRLDFEPESFDAVYAMNCLLHIPKSQIEAVLGQILNVLKPNGLFFYGVYGGWDWEGVWEDDHYEPKRFFSFFEDAAIQELVKRHFELLDFHTVDQGAKSPHFQSISLRKPPA